MDNKCTKYESLFIFSAEDELQAHLEICPDCKEEHSKMLQVASLAKEVKPFLNKGPVKINLLSKVAACLIISLLAFSSVKLLYKDNLNPYNLNSIKESSVITQMGLPTDDYGLLDVG